jgi:type VI secretion system secreted protein VgrG
MAQPSAPQTAPVVGPEGEEIYTDEYGRVKVQFRWDRYGKADENSSMFLRLAQSWAGNKWGAQILPRVGMEVVVEFLEGDPDRPIVTACRAAQRTRSAQESPGIKGTRDSVDPYWRTPTAKL